PRAKGKRSGGQARMLSAVSSRRRSGARGSRPDGQRRRGKAAGVFQQLPQALRILPQQLRQHGDEAAHHEDNGGGAKQGERGHGRLSLLSNLGSGLLSRQPAPLGAPMLHCTEYGTFDPKFQGGTESGIPDISNAAMHLTQ